MAIKSSFGNRFGSVFGSRFFNASESSGAPISPSDPYWDNVTFLLRANGTENTAEFIDESKYNEPLVVGSGAIISNTISKFGNSAFKSTSSSAIITPTTFHKDRYLLDGQTSYTIEFWIYRATFISSSYPISCFDSSTASNIRGWSISIENGILTFRSSNGSNSFKYSGLNIVDKRLDNSQWYHCAICRDGSTLRTFVDGVLTGEFLISHTISSTFNAGRKMTIFQRYTGGSSIESFYLDDVRITNGVARYTSNFTPPTESFPTK